MKEILFASGNRHKADEAKKIFSRSGIRIKWAKISLLEPDFESLREISEHKALDAFRKLDKPAIVEDTGIYFSAYKNFPGQYAKRMFLSLGFEGLLKLLEGKERKAHFATTACYYDGKKLLCSTGKLYGKILESPEGEDKDVLPYEKIFQPNGKSRPLSLIPRKEKNAFSHRCLAFSGLAAKINSMNQR